MLELRCRNTYYHVRLLQAEDRTEGGILIPETARDDVTDGIVLDAGPGKPLDGGGYYPMQAAVGDRVVVPKHFFFYMGADDGFVADEHLAARIPGPDHEEILPANDYALIEPDLMPRFKKSEGGRVLVASFSLPGRDVRLGFRGREILGELRFMQQQPWFTEMPYEDQIRKVHDVMDGLSPEERAALGDAIQEEQSGQRRTLHRPIIQYEKPNSGRIVAFGPGKVNRKGERELQRPSCYKEEHSILPQKSWPLRDLQEGDRVYWDAQSVFVSMSDGERNLLALPVQHLCAVRQGWEVPT